MLFAFMFVVWGRLSDGTVRRGGTLCRGHRFLKTCVRRGLHLVRPGSSYIVGSTDIRPCSRKLGRVRVHFDRHLMVGGAGRHQVFGPAGLLGPPGCLTPPA